MVGTGSCLGAAASSPVRTESQAGLGDLASLHVTVRLQRPHVSGRRWTNTNSAIYPFRGYDARQRLHSNEGECAIVRACPERRITCRGWRGSVGAPGRGRSR